MPGIAGMLEEPDSSTNTLPGMRQPVLSPSGHALSYSAGATSSSMYRKLFVFVEIGLKHQEVQAPTLSSTGEQLAFKNVASAPVWVSAGVFCMITELEFLNSSSFGKAVVCYNTETAATIFVQGSNEVELAPGIATDGTDGTGFVFALTDSAAGIEPHVFNAVSSTHLTLLQDNVPGPTGSYMDPANSWQGGT